MKNDVYVLAHEVKNPLCIIKGYLEMINPLNLQEYKKIIENELIDSIEILDNYLEYNQLKINKEEIDITLLLSEIKSQMLPILRKRGIKFKIQNIDNEIYLEADYNKLKQVFYNIIKNAYEAEAKNIFISYRIIYDKIEIKIENDGIKIIDPTLLGNNYSNKVLGHGIGTTLSKKIIMLHNGKIEYFNDKKYVNCLITLTLK